MSQLSLDFVIKRYLNYSAQTTRKLPITVLLPRSIRLQFTNVTSAGLKILQNNCHCDSFLVTSVTYVERCLWGIMSVFVYLHCIVLIIVL